MSTTPEPLLQARDLSLQINGSPILQSVSFDLHKGETLGLVGESGSGKSMTALSIMQLLPQGTQLTGSLVFQGQDLLRVGEAEMCAIRGRAIAMAFQEPMTALNPVQTIGAQVAEVFLQHQKMSSTEALGKAADMLTKVGLPPVEYPLSRYPYELSGGQRQRVVIAIALALKPALLIADEPTTALDVTTEAEILDLLQSLCDDEGIAMLYISHDLACVARLSDRIAIMKDGEIVEHGATTAIFNEMQHPYSIALRDANSYLLNDKDTVDPDTDEGASVLLEARNVTRDYTLARKHFFEKPGTFRAVDGINLSLRKGENVGLVGESGSGKSTLVRALLGLEPLQAGRVDIGGQPFSPASKKQQQALRRNIQAVFQDPFGSFNPKHTVQRIIGEPLHLLETPIDAGERRERVGQSLARVGLSRRDAFKYPHEFSGGQRQRIAIARAIIIEPSILILDEATSALDVSVRGQVLALLKDLSDQNGISCLFVSHDLDVVRAVTDRTLIMKNGRIVEEGPTAQIFEAPTHAYTRSLIEARPVLSEEIAKRQREQG